VKPDDKPRQNEDTAARKIDGAYYVIDSETSELHSFNKVGSLIYELSDGEHTVADIVAAVVESFEVDRETAERDVVEFLETLLAKNLIFV
jgi:Coenzyme PQQ synthesis protein D (PqqD)